MYRHITDSRIVGQTTHFVALPTIGQIFPGSLLILPRRHHETCAGLGAELHSELVLFVRDLTATAKRFGEPVYFEHGATACSGGSCGIYHAHLHLVPLPERVHPSELFEEHRAAANDLVVAFEALEDCGHYLLMGSEDGVVFADVDALDTRPTSQHFRRILSERFGVDRPWDWRRTTAPEPDVIATIAEFGGSNDSKRTSYPA